jgi:DNA repair exonuclease SbcCD ATPase subunit
MARTASTTPEQIRSTILTMLSEAHETVPASRERFRRVVSVRKLRERLGAGDPATLGRAINAIETELVHAGLADIAIPAIPPDIAELMQQLWQTAVGVQLDDLTRLKSEARQKVEAAQAQLVEATLRVEVLKEELGELRSAASARDTVLAQLRAEQTTSTGRYAQSQTDLHDVQEQLQVAVAENALLKQSQADALATVHQRYEGLSKQLMQETAQQRQEQQEERNRLASQLKFAERRIATLETSLGEAEHELAREREQRQKVAGEASAFKAINASQRAQLDDLLRVALTNPPMKKKTVNTSSKPATALVSRGAKQTKPAS